MKSRSSVNEANGAGAGFVERFRRTHARFAEVPGPVTMGRYRELSNRNNDIIAITKLLLDGQTTRAIVTRGTSASSGVKGAPLVEAIIGLREGPDQGGVGKVQKAWLFYQKTIGADTVRVATRWRGGRTLESQPVVVTPSGDDHEPLMADAARLLDAEASDLESAVWPLSVVARGMVRFTGQSDVKQHFRMVEVAVGLHEDELAHIGSAARDPELNSELAAYLTAVDQFGAEASA